MMLLGHVGVRAVHVLGDGADLVVGEAAERLGDELEVVGEMRRAGAVLHAPGRRATRGTPGDRCSATNGIAGAERVELGCPTSRLRPTQARRESCTASAM